MSNAIQTTQPGGLAPFFSPEQERMILSNFLGGASKDEATVLLEIVKRRRLDPFARQVYFVKRWDSSKREEVWAIQISIDGLRSLAERTDKYDGQDEPEYGEDDAGKFCKVKVYRKDWSSGRAAVGIAYLAEFIQKKKDGTVTAFWARMPRLMLAKCAEALAIRKAFPEDTAGLYIPEEMPETPPAAHAEPAHAPPVEVLPPEKAAPAKSAAFPYPPHVLALWNRLKDEHGETKGTPTKARAALEAAALAVFGDAKKPTSEWTVEETAEVSRRCFDIAF